MEKGWCFFEASLDVFPHPSTFVVSLPQIQTHFAQIQGLRVILCWLRNWSFEKRDITKKPILQTKHPGAG